MFALPLFQPVDQPIGGKVAADVGGQPFLKRMMPKWKVNDDSAAEECGEVAERRPADDERVGGGHALQCFDGVGVYLLAQIGNDIKFLDPTKLGVYHRGLRNLPLEAVLLRGNHEGL